MAQRFESEPELQRDAMTDAEVREVLARLSREKMSPQVQDVADIAGASEADVRRVLQELRAEQAATSVEASPVTTARVSPFLMGRNQKQIPVAVVAAALLLLLGLLLAFFSTSTVAPVQTAAPQPVISGEGPSQEAVAAPAEN